MTEKLASNLKYLRLRRKWSQKSLGEKCNLNASTISAYENGRSVPKLTNLMKIANVYNRSLDDLINETFAEKDLEIPTDTKGQQIRILPILVEEESDAEKVSLVSVKAAAGYMNGYADAEYIAELPQFSLPFTELAKEKTYRVFQIEGDSMLPIPSKSYIICEYVQNWEQLAYGDPHIVITNDDGVVFKRPMRTVYPQVMELHSDNTEFETFEMEMANIMEIWKARGYVSFNLGERLIDQKPKKK